MQYFQKNLQESGCFRLQTCFARFDVEYINGNKNEVNSVGWT